jgi:putative tricarboxylic transport membrane protein
MKLSWTAGIAGACLLLIAQAAPSAAQTVKYPHQNVTLVTHSSPGGGSDVFLRELIKHLQPVMGTNFAVENVRGGSGAKAVGQVAKAPADGTMLYATTPTYIQTTLLSKPEAGYQDLDPIVIVFFDPQLLYTRADAPWKTAKEAIEYAKANPDKARWGAANPASLERIALERLGRIAGVKVPVVSHEGGADLMVNILNGTLDMGVGEVQEPADGEGTGLRSRSAQVPRPCRTQRHSRRCGGSLAQGDGNRACEPGLQGADRQGKPYRLADGTRRSA